MQILNKNIVLALHIALGFILVGFPFLSTYLGIFVVILATYSILGSKKYNDLLPLQFSSYIIGLEVLLRMCKSSLFWEFGKYSIIYFIILGLLRRKSGFNMYWPIVVYFLLLLPSIIHVPFESINLWRQDVAFNLSGPLCLTALSIYLYNVRLKKTELAELFYYSLLPIISMSIVIILKMPDIQSYVFSPYSDPSTSGGYGPNQVSTIFGFIITGLSFGQFFKKNITGSKSIDIACLVLFIGLGLITFSRGGLFAAMIAITLSTSVYYFSNFQKIEIIFKSLLILVVTIVTWSAIVDITEGVISQRYGMSKGPPGEKSKLDLTGRLQIYEIDMQIFKDNLISGVGPGQGYRLRDIYGYGKQVAAHTEFSRMLAEHGMFGLMSLTCLIGIPFKQFFRTSSKDSKTIKILFGTLALLTMLHTAMRISMPCFAFGLLFPKYYD